MTRPSSHNVIACIPIHGRIPLFIHTVQRLLERNGVSRVICVGDKDDDRAVVRLLGDRVEWVQHANDPLGAKWNAAFRAAAAYEPDAILFVGSSDWLSDNWVPIGMKHLKQHDMVGRLDNHLLDIDRKHGYRVCHWAGYTNERQGECIGIGRMLGRSILEKINYTPFNPTLNVSMDKCMHDAVTDKGGSILAMVEKDAFSLGISTDRWVNKHNFSDHFEQRIPSAINPSPMAFLSAHFPEAFQIFS